jgi:hypothetical protein
VINPPLFSLMAQWRYKQFGETLGERSDPMTAGLDVQALRPLQALIQEKQERHELPPDYDVHRSVQLLPQR